MANYQVFTAENGKAGIETAIKEIPDLIICDIMMPVLDGYGVLHLLHKNTALQNIPFIFLSAKSERLDIRKGMEMGADDYIPKPFDETELLNAVESRLRKTDLLKQEWMHGLEGLNKLIHITDGKNLLLSLIEDCTVNRYRKKQIIYQEGTRPSRLYFIQKGKVKTYKTGLAYNSLRKKVAEALMTLHKKYKAPIDISREHLATIAGTATESLIRTLSDFKCEGLVNIKGGTITILNEKKLSTLLINSSYSIIFFTIIPFFIAVLFIVILFMQHLYYCIHNRKTYQPVPGKPNYNCHQQIKA